MKSEDASPQLSQTKCIYVYTSFIKYKKIYYHVYVMLQGRIFAQVDSTSLSCSKTYFYCHHLRE